MWWYLALAVLCFHTNAIVGKKCGTNTYKSGFIGGQCAKCPLYVSKCRKEAIEDRNRCFKSCRKTLWTVKPSLKVMPTPVVRKSTGSLLRTTLPTKASNQQERTLSTARITLSTPTVRESSASSSHAGLSTKAPKKQGQTLSTAKAALRMMSTPLIRKSSASPQRTTLSTTTPYEQGTGTPNVPKVPLTSPTSRPTLPLKPQIVLHNEMRNSNTFIVEILLSVAALLALLVVVAIVFRNRNKNEPRALPPVYTAVPRNASQENVNAPNTDPLHDVENASTVTSVSQQNFDNMEVTHL